MDIKDVKVGDRCWVSYDLPCDEYGQNATVRAVYPNTAPALTKQIGYLNVEDTQYAWTPGISVFWRKPEAPPKPRRKVTKTFTRWVDQGNLCSLNGNRAATLHMSKGCHSDIPATITVEVEE